MKRLLSTLILSGAVIAALGAAPQKAQAHTSVFLNFGFPAPVVYAQPRPVVYYPPQPVYVGPPVLVERATYYPYWDHRFDHHHEWDHRHF